MGFAAKYLSKEYVSKQIATLAKALESVSTNLSLITLLGLALIPLAPHGAALTRARVAQPPPAAARQEKVATVPSAPVELVRAKPVPLAGPAPSRMSALAVRPPEPLLSSDPEAAASGPSASARVLARLSRDRRRRSQQRARGVSGEDGKAGSRFDSGELGKAAKADSGKTPVTPPDPKAETVTAEPPEPDVWSDEEIITALQDCLRRLAPLEADIEIVAPVKKEQCGNAAPVLLKRIGSGAGRVEFQPPPMLNCVMVASLHKWVEKTLQPAAEETLGTSIARIRGAAGYACRNRNGTRHQADRLSEHAHANAVDIMGFVTADGRTIDVLSQWGPTQREIRERKEQIAEAKAAARRAAREVLEETRETARQAQKEAAEAARAVAKLPAGKRKQAKAEADRKKKEAERKAEDAERKSEEAQELEAELREASLRPAGLQKLGRGVDTKAIPTTATDDAERPSAEATFLRRLHKGACTAFGTVLGPEANEAHRNHFHFDLAPRRRRAFCE